MAKGLPTLIRLRTWELDQKRRRLAELETLKVQLQDAVLDLADQVVKEQAVAARDEEVAFSYGAFAKKAILRRRDLEASIREVSVQVEAAADEVASAYQDLKKLEVAQANREAREKAEADRKEQIRLDDIALEQFRQRKLAEA
jgi:flagellar FliJ protein